MPLISWRGLAPCREPELRPLNKHMTPFQAEFRVRGGHSDTFFRAYLQGFGTERSPHGKLALSCHILEHVTPAFPDEVDSGSSSGNAVSNP